MTNNFTDFRNIQTLDKTAANLSAAAFIDYGSMSTTITVGNVDYTVGLVYNDKEIDNDRGYLYSKAENAFSIGTTFSWTDSYSTTRHYIIIDDVPSVKAVSYHQYIVLQCNIVIDGKYGYMMNTAQKYIDTKLQSNIMEISLAKPILVFGEDLYNITDIIPIGTRKWRVLEKDDYSTTGLVFLSLESFVSRNKPDDSTILPVDEVEYDEEVRAGTQLNLATEQGYFISSPEIEAEITPTVIYLTIPYTISSITINTMYNSNVVSKVYKVVK